MRRGGVTRSNEVMRKEGGMVENEDGVRVFDEVGNCVVQRRKKKKRPPDEEGSSILGTASLFIAYRTVPPLAAVTLVTGGNMVDTRHRVARLDPSSPKVSSIGRVQIEPTAGEGGGRRRAFASNGSSPPTTVAAPATAQPV